MADPGFALWRDSSPFFFLQPPLSSSSLLSFPLFSLLLAYFPWSFWGPHARSAPVHGQFYRSLHICIVNNSYINLGIRRMCDKNVHAQLLVRTGSGWRLYRKNRNRCLLQSGLRKRSPVQTNRNKSTGPPILKKIRASKPRFGLLILIF